MNDKLTYAEMQEMLKWNLYTFNSETELATPNYRYCKKDAPVYCWQPDDNGIAFVKVK